MMSWGLRSLATSMSAIAIAATYGCAGADEDRAMSSVSLPLVSTTASGQTYVLENARVDIRQGTTLVTSLVGDDADLSETALTADLPAGDYTANLVDGWQLVRVQPDETRVPVEATLRGNPARDITVQNNATVTLTYVFDAPEGQVAFGGSVEVGFVVEDGPRPVLPTFSGVCPTMATGTIRVLDHDVRLWVGDQQPDDLGPVLFYWHATGSTANEARTMLGGVFDDILARGGVIASFTSSTQTGSNTSGTGLWYSGDFALADAVLACAVEQLNIDTRRIYSAGCSVGGLQSGAMAYDRSSYLAGAIPNSGGLLNPRPLQSPAHVPSVMTAHGGAGDVVVINFSTTSANLYNDIAARGGIAVNCNHGGGHCAAPQALRNAQWQFLLDHPFGVSPAPYAAGLPAGFPSYCTVIDP